MEAREAPYVPANFGDVVDRVPAALAVPQKDALYVLHVRNLYISAVRLSFGPQSQNFIESPAAATHLFWYEPDPEDSVRWRASACSACPCKVT
jgi:hypothetical protein